MGPAVYILGALTSLACAFLLLRAFRLGRRPLLLWSGICFAILGLSNALVFVDLVMLPEIDLYRWRLISAAVAMMVLLYGLIWEDR